jgi:formylglycine-generating enzyme required for sulfatase activity
VTELLAARVRPCVPQETLTLPGGVPMTFAFIPPGAFLMGNEKGRDDEKPVHRVEVARGFFLSAYPVTQAQWFAVLGTDPSHVKGATLPVGRVSWNECRAFSAALSVLTGQRVEPPSEVEWEYACRAGTTTEFHFGDVISTDLANYNGTGTWNGSPPGERRGEATDVGSFPPNPWGLFDLHGNVWEWCADAYGPYPATRRDPGRPESDDCERSLRGGSWYFHPEVCRAAHRGKSPPTRRFSYFGLRVCLHPD